MKAARTYQSAWLKRRSREWNAAWKAMAERTGDHDFVARDPWSGEAWQYMGTYKKDERGWRHEFRHRQHPTLHRLEGRWVLTVPASEAWKPADEKPRKVRAPPPASVSPLTQNRRPPPRVSARRTSST